MAITHTLFGFKTGYLQYAQRLEKVATFSDESGDVFKIGQLVTLTAANSGTPAYLSKGTTPRVGDYIIAQGIDTGATGHVPTDEKNYKPKGYITVSETSSMSSSSEVLPYEVVVYKITNLDDLVKLS